MLNSQQYLAIFLLINLSIGAGELIFAPTIQGDEYYERALQQYIDIKGDSEDQRDSTTYIDDEKNYDKTPFNTFYQIKQFIEAVWTILFPAYAAGKTADTMFQKVMVKGLWTFSAILYIFAGLWLIDKIKNKKQD